MSRRTISLALAAILLSASLFGTTTPHLLGPDETREVEIAREMARSNELVVPRLDGLPYLEKPPLYYLVLSSIFARVGIGESTPFAARLVSLACGWATLAAIFVLARATKSWRAGWLAVVLLLQMPGFWEFSHTILLDGMVAAEVTLFLVSWSFWRRAAPGRRASMLAACAGLALGAAFVTKSVPPVAMALAIVAADLVLDRGTRPALPVGKTIALATFLLPAITWVALLYRAGGWPYLHEHFVNNIVGRALHRHFTLTEQPFFHTDVGRKEGWWYYLEFAPTMLGLCALLLPFALRDRFSRDAQQRIGEPTRADARNDSARRADARDESIRRANARLWAAWALVPLVLLSIPESKARSYYLLALPGSALLCATWADDAIERWLARDSRGESELFAPWFALPLISLAVLLAGGTLSSSIALACAVVAALGAWAIASLRSGRKAGAFSLLLLLCTAGETLFSGTAIGQQRRLARSLKPFAPIVWDAVGSGELYLFLPSDRERGAIPFYGNRDVSEVDRLADLVAVLAKPDVYCLVDEDRYVQFENEPALLAVSTVVFRREVSPRDHYVLIRSGSGAGASGR